MLLNEFDMLCKKNIVYGKGKDLKGFFCRIKKIMGNFQFPIEIKIENCRLYYKHKICYVRYKGPHCPERTFFSSKIKELRIKGQSCIRNCSSTRRK